MKSKILFHQVTRVEAARSRDNRWVRATLISFAPPKGLTYRRCAHVLQVSVDDGDTQTWYEDRTLLESTNDAESIRFAISEMDRVFEMTIMQMGNAGLLYRADEEEDDLAF